MLAAPGYLQSAPALTTPQDLEQHRCIALRENDEDATMWRLADISNGQITSVRVNAVLASNVSQVTKDWCIKGEGIIQRSEWDVKQELSAGTLVRVLPQYQLAEADIVALVASERLHRSDKVSAFLEFVQHHLPARLSC
ncbi:LysR substrate-binding domain-containing protein [Vibrio sp. CDRSL-10 TSBA]